MTPPVTRLQQTVLDALTDEPAERRDLVPATGLTSDQVCSALYALQAKSLARRTAGGWMLDPYQEQNRRAA